jgi:ribonuclease BN (tRNA processing enzyme)
MQLARLAQPKRLLLTHLYPEWDAYDLAAEARTLWEGETIAAVDGLRLEI